jgi:hypothetical protein
MGEVRAVGRVVGVERRGQWGGCAGAGASEKQLVSC